MYTFKEIIAKKRSGKALKKGEIQSFVSGICSGAISKQQISALLMAIYLKGMNQVETTELTKAMAFSGKVLDLSRYDTPTVDKHSTGGVGDKTSLVLIPLMATCGLKMAKLSGRALGHTGGTLDKLACFSGIRLDLGVSEMHQLLASVGCFISGQTAEMVPADKIMYALRDQTGTVSSLPLIASSIMSKKIAGGAKYILLDVKVGTGAIFNDLSKSRSLAEWMVMIGKSLGRPTRAVLTSMNQPLGNAVGNCLELAEALQTLKGGGPEDFRRLCFYLGHQILQLSGITETEADSQILMSTKINSGEALRKFKEMIAGQSGNTSCFDDPASICPGDHEPVVLKAIKSGFVASIDTKAIGIRSMEAMEPTENEALDLKAGIILHKKIGEKVERGDNLPSIYGRDMRKLKLLSASLREAFTIMEYKTDPSPLIIDLVS